ncbi:MAG: 4Fe-4S binding protein [Candidatus Omnitrophica bacterium]|nr:4Fe-4S binding protein [Candidatus Omnitrophota bacterium]
MKLVYGIILLPVIILPAFRCSFKVPYVFCRVCPTECPWGMLRTVIFSGALFLNLFGRFWCTYLCPLGTIQERQARISKWNFKLPSWAGYSAYIVLILTIGIYSLSLAGSSLVGYFEAGYYIFIWKTMFAASAIFATAFFIPMFWCRYMCPVGTIAGICETIRRKNNK